MVRRTSLSGYSVVVQLEGKVIVVTGGGHGIGRALCVRFAQERPRALVVADIDGAAAEATARATGGLAKRVDVSREQDLRELVSETEERYGTVDLLCSNAGVLAMGGVELPDEEWRRVMDVNFQAHLWAARAAIPGMIERGGGYLLQTVSAAGMLTQIGSAPYAVSKHAALALAEWISMTHGADGIGVSCLCPQGVRTRMLLGEDGEQESFLREGSVSAEEVAEAAAVGLAEERFLILPHPEVAEYEQRRATDRDRWLQGMRKLRARVEDSGANPS